MWIWNKVCTNLLLFNKTNHYQKLLYLLHSLIRTTIADRKPLTWKCLNLCSTLLDYLYYYISFTHSLWTCNCVNGKYICIVCVRNVLRGWIYDFWKLVHDYDDAVCSDVVVNSCASPCDSRIDRREHGVGLWHTIDILFSNCSSTARHLRGSSSTSYICRRLHRVSVCTYVISLNITFTYTRVYMNLQKTTQTLIYTCNYCKRIRLVSLNQCFVGAKRIVRFYAFGSA